MTNGWSGSVVPFLSLVIVAGCGEVDARADAYSVRDSAGVRIVENRAPSWTESGAWRLCDEPIVAIGEIDGPQAYQLHQVGGAHRLTDGTVIVRNGGTQEIRYFDAEGRFLRSIGRRGGGPGEFQGLAESFAVADSILAYDMLQQRISAFGPDGTLLRSFRTALPEPGPPARPVGRLPDGSWLLSASRGQQGSGLQRDSVVYYRLREDDEPARRIGGYPGREMITERSTAGEMVVVSFTHPPFGRIPSATLVAGRIAHAGTDTYEIEILDADGVLTALIRREHTPEPVGEEDLRRWDEWTRPAAPPPGAPEPERRTPRAADLPLPPTKAAHGPIRSDAGGNLWVAEYGLPLKPPVEWSIFDPDGRWLGQIRTPDGLRITEIGDDYLLGVARDDLGVEYVHLYRLIKP